MSKKLWKASLEQKKKSILFSFETFLLKNINQNFNGNYEKILNWSIKNSSKFWSLFWDFSKIKGKKGKKEIQKSKIFYKNLFLPNSKLNFAKNLLSKINNEKAATFISENGFREERTWLKLNENTNKIVQFLKSIKIKKNDRVAAYTSNTIETVEAFIATSAIGAIWSSCSPDFGIKGVVERFSQINPKVLFITDQYFYNGKKINVLERLSAILKSIPSIKNVVIVNYPGKKNVINHSKYKKIKLIKWREIIQNQSEKINFKKYDFESELAILYSSGTTGKPKCICHRSGGVLLLAQMSSRGNLLNPNYTDEVVSKGREHNGVFGFIGNGSRPDELSELREKVGSEKMIWTPGVNLDTGDGEMGQRYGDPREAIIAGSDCIIVGSGIHRSANPSAAAKAYASASWNALIEREL